MNIKTESGETKEINEKITALKTHLLCEVILEKQADILSKLNNTTYENEYKKITERYEEKVKTISQQLT